MSIVVAHRSFVKANFALLIIPELLLNTGISRAALLLLLFTAKLRFAVIARARLHGQCLRKAFRRAFSGSIIFRKRA
jgi:hypothetical protein